MEMTPMTTLDLKVLHDMKTLQALYNKDANKIMEQACEKENLYFLIDVAIVAMVVEGTKPTEDETQTFNKAWNHPIAES